MTGVQQIKTLLQEATIYQSQGLIKEAKDKYNYAREQIENDPVMPHREKLLTMVNERVTLLYKDEEELDSAVESPDVTPEVQDLIKTLFTSADTESSDRTALEGAINLARFGQFDRAISEFDALLEVDTLRVSAAKNIIRCHAARSSLDDAVIIFQQWQAGNLFRDRQIETVKCFLEESLVRCGMSKDLIQHETAAVELEISEDDEMIDISAVTINMSGDTMKNGVFDFDVSFQSGNVISLIVSSREKDVIDNFKVGLKLNDVTYYSPIAVFKGSGIVKVKTQISYGPKRGDYNLDIKIEDV